MAALFVLMVVAAAVIMTHMPVASTSSVYKTINADNTIGRNDADKQVEVDVQQDAGRDVNAGAEHVMEKAKQALNTNISTDIYDEAMSNGVVVKKKESPVMKNYHMSGEIDIPSLYDPEVKKQLATAWPSLFCWCIMMTVGNNPLGWMEETLVKQQLDRSIGIFACNEWAVITDDRLALNRWGEHGFPKIPEGMDAGKVTSTWSIGSTSVPRGVETNPMNSMPFKTAWKALQASKKLEHHDWAVKVDPDAVWFPVRLRTHLKTYMPGHGNGWDNIFLKNCPRFNSMQGPIEVISRRAATNLENNIQNCGGVWGTGEDHFIVGCLQQLGVSPVMEAGLLNDKYCDGYIDCSNSWKVAFHPHKNPTRFMECYNTSSGSR
jgi:hypothetical protein